MKPLTPRQLSNHEVEFNPRSEAWSKYESKDGRIQVWAKAIVSKIYHLPKQTTGAPKDGWGTATQTIVAAFFPKSMKGEPNGPHPPELFTKDGTPVDFELVAEPWNEYILPGNPPKLMRVKIVVTGIRYYPKQFNDTCDPIVALDSQVVTSDPIPIPDTGAA